MAITGGKFGTEVTTVAELLAGFGSGSFCPTTARLVMSPLTAGLMTTIWTVRLLVAGTVPKLHTTVPPALEQLPWLLLVMTGFGAAESVSKRSAGAKTLNGRAAPTCPV